MTTSRSKTFLDAAARPLHLAVPAVGGVAALGLTVAGMAPLALAAGVVAVGTWGALIALDLLGQPAPVAPVAPRPASAELLALLGAVDAAASRARAALTETGGPTDVSLREIRRESEAVVLAATEAALRADQAATVLGSLVMSELVTEARERTEQARRAKDPDVRRALELAASAKARELATVSDMQALVRRVMAELVAAEAQLDEIAVRVARVSLDGVGQASVGQELRELAERLQVLETAAKRTGNDE